MRAYAFDRKIGEYSGMQFRCPRRPCYRGPAATRPALEVPRLADYLRGYPPSPARKPFKTCHKLWFLGSNPGSQLSINIEHFGTSSGLRSPIHFKFRANQCTSTLAATASGGQYEMA